MHHRIRLRMAAPSSTGGIRYPNDLAEQTKKGQKPLKKTKDERKIYAVRIGLVRRWCGFDREVIATQGVDGVIVTLLRPFQRGQ